MSRDARSTHLDAFDAGGDFNQQMYAALKQSPWWMISISVHVLFYVISALAQSGEALKVQEVAGIHGEFSSEKPPEEEIKKEDDESEPVHETDLVAKEPVIKDAEISDHVETDNDMPFEESLGTDGLSDAPWDGPANNGLIGIGGGKGGAFGGRGGRRNLRPPGGGARPRSEDAVEDALRWLAAHQSADGGWECAGFNRWCEGKLASGPGPEGLGKATYDPGVTGLALLAFLGAGYTNRGDHPFAKVVQGGLRYLKNIQDPEGCFGPRASGHFVYNHAIAALAMVEAYGMTGSAIYRGPAQKSLDFIAITRNPYFAWRYGVKPGENDTSVTGWMMMALKSAKLVNSAEVKAGRPAPLVVDEDAFDGIRTWVDKMTDPDTGRVGYIQRGTGPARPADLVDRFPAEKSESMTGVGLLARIFLGEDPRKSEVIQRGAKVCANLAPTWNPNDGSIDMYYWYYATLAMYQVGGDAWKKWNEAMKPAIVDSQRRDGDFCMYKGSWDNVDPWGPDGGRVYSTAIMALCLEVYYRYDRVSGIRDEGGH